MILPRLPGSRLGWRSTLEILYHVVQKPCSRRGNWAGIESSDGLIRLWAPRGRGWRSTLKILYHVVQKPWRYLGRD